MHCFLSVCLSVTGPKFPSTKIHISGGIAPRVMKFGMGMYLDDIWIDLEGRGHRSKVKVTR